MAQANHIECSVTTRDAALIIILLELLDLVQECCLDYHPPGPHLSIGPHILGFLTLL